MSAFGAWNHSGQLLIMRGLAGDEADVLASAERKMKRTWFFDYVTKILKQPSLGYRVSRSRVLFCLCEIINFPYCLNELRQNFQLLAFPFDTNLSLSPLFMTLHLLASLPSPIPAYYNLFQYTSLLNQMVKLKYLFENIFYFPAPHLCMGLPHISEMLSAPFLHTKILRTHSSQYYLLMKVS